MPNVKLGKTIEKILYKSRKEEMEEASEQTVPSATPAMPPSLKEKVYLKALPLRSIEDVETIKQEVKLGNILIVRVSPLAKKSIDDVKRAVTELCEFTESIGGDIARLGEERVVVTPSFVKIWREKTETAPGDPTEA